MRVHLLGAFLGLICLGELKLMAFEIDASGHCKIDGTSYPAVGFSTYPLKNEICYQAVLDAAQVGYRILDTATFYRNFEPIGRALKKLGRQNFYIISKVWPDSQSPERIQKDLKKTLDQLQTTYLDAYLVHWSNSNIPIKTTLLMMDALRQRGLIRHIGLSNVTVKHLKKALEANVPIAWVQVEMHPLYYDSELLEFCRQHAIRVQAWAPLARGNLSEDSLLTKLGEKYGKNASQVAIKWIVQHDCIPLPGSKNPVHMQQNMDIMDFALTNEEMQEIDARAKTGNRVPEKTDVGFSDEFDFSYDKGWP